MVLEFKQRDAQNIPVDRRQLSHGPSGSVMQNCLVQLSLAVINASQ